MKKNLVIIISLLLVLTGCKQATYSNDTLDIGYKNNHYQINDITETTIYNQLNDQISEYEIEFTSETPIIVLSTSTANILDAIGLNIVGTVDSKDLNENLQTKLNQGEIVNLGSALEPNLEQIAKVDYQLSFVSSSINHSDAVNKIDNLIRLSQETYSDVLITIYSLITITDTGYELFDQLMEIDQQAKALMDDRYQDDEVLVLRYAYDAVKIASDASFVGSLAVQLNLNNIYGDNKDIAVETSLEHILTLNPDVIIILGKGDEMETYFTDLMNQGVFDNLAAYQNDKLFILKSQSLSGNIDSPSLLLKLSQEMYE